MQKRLKLLNGFGSISYYIIRDSKTEAGRNRAVPISHKLLKYFEAWIQSNGF